MNTKFTMIMLAILLCASVACKKEKELPEQILIGNWQMENSGQVNSEKFVDKYTFDNKGNFTYEKVVQRKSDETVLGYMAVSTGRYTIANGQITFYDRVGYHNNSDPYTLYVSKDKLVRTNEISNTVNYTLQKNPRKLTLSFECPPNAFCAGPLTFTYNPEN
jgi:hypothetical protein